MHKNLFWQAFLLFIGAVTLWYSVSAVYHYYVYSHMTSQAGLETIQWQIEAKNDETYLLNAQYSFKANNRVFENSTLFTEDPHLNRWAAEKALENESKKSWKVWFNPSSPSYSTLDKRFPFKSILYAGILWALFLYFLWIGYYVARFKT